MSPTRRRVEGQRGQPATLVSINPKGAFGIGVRLDRDAIESILVDLDGEIIGRRVHDRLLPAPAETLALVVADIDALLASLGKRERERIAASASPSHTTSAPGCASSASTACEI